MVLNNGLTQSIRTKTGIWTILSWRHISNQLITRMSLSSQKLWLRFMINSMPIKIKILLWPKLDLSTLN